MLHLKGAAAISVGVGCWGVVAVTTISAFFFSSSNVTSPKTLKKSALTLGSLATTGGLPAIFVRSPLFAPVPVALRMPAWLAPRVQLGSLFPSVSLLQPWGIESLPLIANALPLKVIGLVTVTAAFTLTDTKLRRARVATVRCASSLPAASVRLPRLVSRKSSLLSRVTVLEYFTSVRPVR